MPPEELTRHVYDLEGRLAALSGVLGALMWVLRARGVMDSATEQLIYRSASQAITAGRPETEAAADRLILALQSATEVEFGAGTPERRGS